MTIIGYCLIDESGNVMRWSYPSKEPAIYAQLCDAERSKDNCTIAPVYVDGQVGYAPMKERQQAESEG